MRYATLVIRMATTKSVSSARSMTARASARYTTKMAKHTIAESVKSTAMLSLNARTARAYIISASGG